MNRVKSSKLEHWHKIKRKKQEPCKRSKTMLFHSLLYLSYLKSYHVNHLEDKTAFRSELEHWHKIKRKKQEPCKRSKTMLFHSLLYLSYLKSYHVNHLEDKTAF